MNLDNNFIYFLVDKMTKAKVYPPKELKREIGREEVLNAWENLLQRLNDPDFQDHKFGLYLHLPFCPSKCSFCYCPSRQENDFNKIKAYVAQLKKEVDLYSPGLKNLAVDSIYVGGGTPSHLTVELINDLFAHIFSSFKMSDDLQFNFEASPHTLSAQKLDLLKSLGVTRLSMGVQSISGKVLNNIKREQSLSVLKNIVDYARKIGIPHLNLDYVAGLPGETLQSFMIGFTEILKLRPEIIHLYAFCPTEDTLFIKEGNIYSEQQIANRSKMQRVGEQLVRKAGYKEIKNDSWGLLEEAKNRQEAGRKEFPYSILGLGNSARSNVFKIMAYTNNSDHYNFPQGKIYGHSINDEEELRHFLMLSFRGGVNKKEIKRIFGFDIEKLFAQELNFLQKNGNLKIDGDNLILNAKNTNEYHFLLKKLFYSPEVINSLAEYYKNEYMPTINYQEKLAQNFDNNF